MRLEYQDPEWRPFFAAVERRLSKQAFETWFRPLTACGNRVESVLRISAPNPVVRDWIVSQYSHALEESLVESKLSDCRIEWDIRSATDKGSNRPADASTASTSRLLQSPPLTGSALDLSPCLAAPTSSLNEKYTFDTFVVASCNRFAHAALQAIAEAP